MELIGIVKYIKFKKIQNNIQQEINKDIEEIKKSKEVYIKSDKTDNLYKINKNKYKQLLHK